MPLGFAGKRVNVMDAGVQHWVALAMVAVAGAYVGWRIWGQIAAFRGRPARRRRPAGSAKSAAPPVTPLIQIQTRPPVHLKRPPAE